MIRCIALRANMRERERERERERLFFIPSDNDQFKRSGYLRHNKIYSNILVMNITFSNHILIARTKSNRNKFLYHLNNVKKIIYKM